MKSRVASGVGKTALLAVVALSMSGCSMFSACSTVGYIYAGPAVLYFSEPIPEDAVVSACFGANCDPAVIESDDGTRWDVPQELPYLADGLPVGGEHTIRVTVSRGDGAVLSDDEYRIPISVEKTGVFGQCPGPFSFEPVNIDLGE